MVRHIFSPHPQCTQYTRGVTGTAAHSNRKGNRSTTALAEIELYHVCWENKRSDTSLWGEVVFWPLASMETFFLSHLYWHKCGEKDKYVLRSTTFYNIIFAGILLLAYVFVLDIDLTGAGL